MPQWTFVWVTRDELFVVQVTRIDSPGRAVAGAWIDDTVTARAGLVRHSNKPMGTEYLAACMAASSRERARWLVPSGALLYALRAESAST